MQETRIKFLDWEDLLEKEMAILVKIPPKGEKKKVSIYRQFHTGHWFCRCWMSEMQKMISRSKKEERVIPKDQKFADTSMLESKSLHLLMNCWRCHNLSGFTKELPLSQGWNHGLHCVYSQCCRTWMCCQHYCCHCFCCCHHSRFCQRRDVG